MSNFGEVVEGYDIPVLNEREIRAAAGILFLMMLISVMVVILNNDFLLLKYAVSIFLLDICLRVFVSPRYAPTLILGRLIVRNQVPEYVGAKQKKVAWMIGVGLASVFFVFTVIINSYSPISGIICLICLIFLFFEAAFGICLGCKFYSLVYKDQAQYCPGEVCTVNDRQDIQKTTASQLMVVVGMVLFVVVIAYLFNDFFSIAPYDMFGIDTPKE